MKKILIISLICILLSLLSPFIINLYVIESTKDKIISLLEESDFDCIMVLGAGLKSNGKPNHMLRDRLNKGLELYHLGISDLLLLSGDNGQIYYDEVNSMKKYVSDGGVPLESIFLDHAGFSTYESIYRAREIFQVSKMVIVSQKYHLFRAVYIANKLGIDCIGVPSENFVYFGQKRRDYREFLARNKDFLSCIFKPKPKYLGEIISINGNAILTHDD